jgi:hypothetical protein
VEVSAEQRKERHERLYNARRQNVGGGVNASDNEHEQKNPNGAAFKK